MVDKNLCMRETVTSSCSRLSPSMLPPSILYDGDVTLRNKRKKVTFKDSVQQHLCLVENTAKPYFNSPPKDAPPKYEDYIAMKKSTRQNLSQGDIYKGGGGSAAETQLVSPNSDTLRRKNKDLNNNSNLNGVHTLPRSAKLNGSVKEKIVPDLIIPPKPKSPSVDDGYSTASQNGGTPSTLYAPQSFITSSSQESSKKFFTGKRFNIGSQKSKKSSSSVSSPSQVKKSISPIAKQPQSPPSQIEKPLVVNIDKKEMEVEEKKTNTLTREEIDDLNDLLSMFDEKEQLDPSLGVETETPKQSTPKQEENSTKEKLPSPPSYYETQTLGRKPKQNQQALKPNIPRTQSQNYGRRIDDDLKDNSRRPIGRAHTLTRPSRDSYEKEKTLEQQKASSKASDLDFLQDVVSELLAVGRVDEEAVKKNTITLKRKEPKHTTLPRSVGSIENFFDDIESKAESYSKSLEEDENSGQESEEDNEVFPNEGNDSGIEDEAMPGVTKESSHKRKSSSKHRKHHDGDEHRSSRRSDDRSRERHRDKELKRSDSEPKKSKRHDKKHESERHESRSNSLPRPDKYKVKSNDITVRIDGNDYNSNNIGRHGRPKERRSEPPISNKPPTDPKIKTKSRKSEPAYHPQSSRPENDVRGGTVGNHSRAMTDSQVHKHKKERSKSPDKKERRSTSPSKRSGGNSDDYKRPNGTDVQRNNSVQLPPRPNEYMWDTPDGKHRVYVRQKEEEPGPLPKKEKLRDLDTNIRSMVKGRESGDHAIVDQLGVTPDIIQLLREEERFWQRQQELKEWRRAKEPQYSKSNYNPPPQRSTYEPVTYHSRPEPVSKRSADIHAEVLREAEENRLALQAEKLMKIRAEQEHILKTSRENLLDDIDTARPPPPRNYKGSSYSSNSNYSYPQHPPQTFYTVNKSYPTSPTSERTFPKHAQAAHSNDRHHPEHHYTNGYTEPPPVERNHRLSRNDSGSEQKHHSPRYAEPPQTVTKVYPTMGAFSDDDELNDNSRQNSTSSDYRGYFSDDGFRDNTISKTYLARPMFRQPHAVLRCTACSLIIKDNRLVFVDGRGFYWHSACFKCFVCKALLNDNNAIRVRMVGMKLHCRFCTSARNGEQLSEV